MDQDGNGKAPAQDQSIQDQPVQDQLIHRQPIQDDPIVGPLQDDQGPHESSLLGVVDDQGAADHLLHAAYIVPPDMIASVELTLDHLSQTVDLFDVPPFDYGVDAPPSDYGDTG